MRKTVQVIQLLVDNPIDRRRSKRKHLYLISNEEIKEGELLYDSDLKHIVPAGCFDKQEALTPHEVFHMTKVIASTDECLRLPVIPKLFVKEYYKPENDIKEVDYIINKTLHHGDEIGIQYKNTIYYIRGMLAVEYLLPKKKQTLEEAADEFAKTTSAHSIAKHAFLLGAKWQQSNS